jgi:thiol-disulfide isomerase/thioredoxin
MLQKIFPKLSILLIGAFFVVSAIAKLYPVISFEFSLGSYGIPWNLTPYVARAVISIELILGCLLILQYRLKKMTIPYTIAFLLLMTVVLIYRWITAGADSDCGCMGDWLPMTPIQSIIKNILLIFALLIARKSIEAKTSSSSKSFLMSIIGIISFTAPYIIEPVYIGVNTTHNSQETRPLDIDLFYSENQVDTPKVDLKKGNHIIAFLSITCPHCQKAAIKFGIIQSQHPEYPIHLFINGNDKTVDQFRKEYKCEEVAYSKLLQPQFLQLSGPELPSIQYIKDGVVQRSVDYLDIDNAGIEDFLN